MRPAYFGIWRTAVLSRFVAVQPAARVIFTLDPADGWRKNAGSGFMAEWEPAGRVIIAIFLAASPPRSDAVGSSG
jgi:hypothetical protein